MALEYKIKLINRLKKRVKAYRRLAREASKIHGNISGWAFYISRIDEVKEIIEIVKHERV